MTRFSLIFSLGVLGFACSGDDDETKTDATDETDTDTDTDADSDTDTDTDTDTDADTDTDTGTPPADPTVIDWLLDTEMFGYAWGTYGKPTYCGAFEFPYPYGIPGFEDVRCTDQTTYRFTDNGDGTLRFEEAYYIYRITEQNPGGIFPWFVDNGYAGSIVWTATPVTPALTEASDTEAVEFDMELVEGLGPDSYFEYLATLGIRSKMILARGETDDVLLDWTSADWDADTSSWIEYGHTFPAHWAIEVYPEGGGDGKEIGAFYDIACPAGDRIQGAIIDDGLGGQLPTGPGYCAPICRMATSHDPTGANGLPACDDTHLTDQPRATGLLAP